MGCSSSSVRTPPTLVWRGKPIVVKKCFNLMTHRDVQATGEDFFFRGCRFRGSPKLFQEFCQENYFPFDTREPPQSAPPFSFFGKAGRGRITKVVDGDTYDVALYLHDTPATIRIRLYGIDTYEKDTPRGRECIEHVKGLEGKVVDYYLYSYDKYGRVLADIVVKGKNLREELLSLQYGVEYFGKKKTL